MMGERCVAEWSCESDAIDVDNLKRQPFRYHPLDLVLDPDAIRLFTILPDCHEGLLQLELWQRPPEPVDEAPVDEAPMESSPVEERPTEEKNPEQEAGFGENDMFPAIGS